MTMQPGFEIVCGLLWELAPLADGAIDEGR